MSFSKQDLTRAGIPLDITIEEVYQEYRHGSLKHLPTYIVTLRNKNDRNYTLGELFSTPSNNNRLIDLQANLLSSAAALSQLRVIDVIPNTPFSTLETGLRAFLSEYIELKRKRALVHKAARNLYCDAIRLYYDENDDNPRSRIAKMLGVKVQRVDQLMGEAREDFKIMLLKGESVDRIKAHPDLVRLVNEYHATFTVPTEKAVMQKQSGISSEKLLDCIAYLFDSKILETGVVISKDWHGQQIERNKGAIKRILIEEGIPISVDKLESLLGEALTNDSLKDELLGYARNHHEFEIIHQNNTDYITLQWKYLNNFNAEVIRILYDKNCWGRAKSLSRSELKDEWESRARLAGKKKQFISTYHHWRIQVAKTGNVWLKQDKKESLVSGQQYISGLVTQHPDWTFKDILHQAKTDGYIDIYSIGSLRTYYTNVVKDTRVYDALVEARKELNRHTNCTLSFGTLLSHLNAQGIDIKSSHLRNWIIKNIESFKYFSIPGKKQTYVKLINRKAPLITPRSAKKVSRSSVQPTRSSAVYVAPSLDWNSIRSFISIQVPEIQHWPSLSNSLDDVLTIMKNGANEFSYNSVFLSWLPNLVDSTTMNSWDKDKFRKDLLGSVEPFIENFYKLKLGGDLKTDISHSPGFDPIKGIGLGLMINHLTYNRLLPDKYLQYSKDSIELSILRATRTVKDGRNGMLAHAQATVNLADSVMSAQIHDTLLFFAYLASEL